MWPAWGSRRGSEGRQGGWGAGSGAWKVKPRSCCQRGAGEQVCVWGCPTQPQAAMTWRGGKGALEPGAFSLQPCPVVALASWSRDPAADTVACCPVSVLVQGPPVVLRLRVFAGCPSQWLGWTLFIISPALTPGSLEGFK